MNLAVNITAIVLGVLAVGGLLVQAGRALARLDSLVELVHKLDDRVCRIEGGGDAVADAADARRMKLQRRAQG